MPPKRAMGAPDESPEEAPESEPEPEPEPEQRHVVATFAEEGKLGLVFLRSEPPPLRIADIAPDGLASRDGVLAVGMRLLSVESPDLGGVIQVAELEYAEVIDTLKRAGRPITMTYKLPAPPPTRLAQLQARAQRVQATAQKKLGAASVMVRDVQRQYTVEQQRRRGSVDGTTADAQTAEVQYEIRLPADGDGIGMVVAADDSGAPFVAEFSGSRRAEKAGVRLGSRILAVNGSAVSEGGRLAVMEAVQTAAAAGEPLLLLLVAPASETATKLATQAVAMEEKAAELRAKVAPRLSELRSAAGRRLRDLRYRGLPRYLVAHAAVVREGCPTDSAKVGVLRAGVVVIGLKEERLKVGQQAKPGQEEQADEKDEGKEEGKDNVDDKKEPGEGAEKPEAEEGQEGQEDQEENGESSEDDEDVAVVERVHFVLEPDAEPSGEGGVVEGWVSKCAGDGTLILQLLEDESSDESDEDSDGQVQEEAPDEQKEEAPDEQEEGQEEGSGGDDDKAKEAGEGTGEA